MRSNVRQGWWIKVVKRGRRQVGVSQFHSSKCTVRMLCPDQLSRAFCRASTVFFLPPQTSLAG